MTTKEQISAEISRALTINQDALGILGNAVSQPPLSDALIDAAKALLATDGRLVISGIGKSGHVGRKLAATFSSTGTPAYFVHGAEASHGDLGTICKADCVMILSWSGATQELYDLVNYCQRFGVRLIAMTGNAKGRIAEAADISLVLPKVQESCPHNLAPTSSTLLQMALGDALAVTLLKLRGFSENAFKDFHPGGKLGSSLTPITKIQAVGQAMPLIDVGRSVAETIAELSAKGLGIVGILENGRLVGVVTDGDIRRYLGQSGDLSMRQVMHETHAGDLMTRNPITFVPGLLAGKALSILQTKRISAAFVVDETGIPEGVVTTLSLLESGVGG